MFGLWDWVGMDTYEGGTARAQERESPADRISALRATCRRAAYNQPIGVGEYNGFRAETIAAAGEALLGTPNVWFGCVWNAEGDRGWVLSGDRLTAFQQTLADPRSAEPG